jgi:hypothetical protein
MWPDIAVALVDFPNPVGPWATQATDIGHFIRLSIGGSEQCL